MGLQNSLGAALVDDSFDDVLVAVPSDTIAETTRLKDCRAIRSTAGGAVKLITNRVNEVGAKTGSAVTAAQAVIVTLVAGETLRIRAAYILATGTAAADIELLF